MKNSLNSESICLKAVDTRRWGQFDNDGPDDISNSQDDDGKVDFIVIVHKGFGAECENSAESSLWSHQDLLSNWAGHGAYTTKTKSNSKVGGNIQVDDYVLVPAVACDATTPIQIGVIAHEFGHSLGLPDLYDTSRNARSEGLGNWDLMAGGSWGGDGNSPEMPVHMSAWSKGYLGWVKPKDVTTDISVAALKTYEIQDDVYLVTIDKQKNIYYLISNRQRVRFDSKIPGEGIQILRVNEERLKATLGQNTVNVDPANMGVEVVEADGLKQLIHHPPAPVSRGGPGDTFPGSSHKRVLDNTSTPASDDTIAICEIGDSLDSMSLRIFVSRPNCPAVAMHGSDRISIKALLSSPASFVDATIRVEGFLKNETPNYFRGRPKLTIRDSEGNVISVSPWLPREIPPGPHGQGPPVLAEFLDREVELTGRLKAQPSPDRYIFQVESARILQ
jgi:M6 family metalloprotease-like protein